MKSSRTMGMAAWAVARYPGHTAYWYDHLFGGRATRDRLYSAFARAANHGLIEARQGTRRGTTVYYPL